MVLHTPPMGWNFWNTFGPNINEEVVLRTADTLAASGLAACGYRYLVIDDCWSLRERDAGGHLVADPEKFPHGIRYVSDYVHQKGLLFGMYSCCGPLTCAGYPGSFDHEFEDAATFAAWGVDYLKYDYCYHPSTRKAAELYRRMGLALGNCGRDIVLSACSWGADETKQWIGATGSHLWRSTPDINDSWASIRSLALSQLPDQVYGRINCFNDMDMLVVGMGGKGNVGLTGCSDLEYRTHFSLWAFLNSPLMIGCDVREMSEATRETLTNPEMIAINQDPAGWQPFRLKNWLAHGYEQQPEIFCLGKLLANGDLALGMFNLSDGAHRLDVSGEELALPLGTRRTLALHDVWSHSESRMANEVLQVELPAHGCRVWRAKVVEC